MRPSVGDEMMKRDHKRMVVLVEPHELGAERRLPFKLEGLGKRFAHLALNCRPSPALGAWSDVDSFEPRPRCSHPLHQLAREVRESRAHHLVALADFCDAGL